jgi:glycine/D-amino acid oxidase-like deaminating enzyme
VVVVERVDVAIIGGGVIGSAIACFLAAEPGFGGSVAVLERDPYRTAASALSVSSIRQHRMQQAPAVGRAVAELIAHGTHRTLDLSPLAVTRMFESRPLREENVV